MEIRRVRQDEALGECNHVDFQLSAPESEGAVFSGARWTAASQAGKQVIQFIVSVVLARLLVPEDFGLMAMALVVINFIEIFKDLGTTASIVQRKELSSELLSSVFFLNVIFGLLTGGIVILAAPMIAWLYNNAGLAPIVRVLGLTFVISSLGLVKKALLQRNMAFDSLARVELVAAVVNGSAAIVLAGMGWKVWALVTGTLLGSITSTLLFWLTVSWRPQWLFRWTTVKTVFQFSLNLTGAQIFNYFVFNADKLIIGRFLGAAPLGLYALAQRILMTPVLFITQVLTRVLFPAFARIQDDDAQIRQRYLRACGGIAMVSFPLMAAMSILARPLILAVFSTKWSGIIPLIIILAPIGVFQSIATTVGVIYMVKRRTDWLFWWQILSGGLITASFFGGLAWGVIGVASGYAITLFALAYPAFAIPFRLIGLKFGELLSTLRPYASATLLMAVQLFTCRLLLEHFGYGINTVLIAGMITSAVAYAAIILLMRPAALADFRKLLF